MKNRHELFTPSDKRTEREWERDLDKEMDRERDEDGAWVIQRERQTDGLTRTVGYYIVLAVTMTETLRWSPRDFR